MSEVRPNAERVLADTRQWLERMVIGLNLCPFARAPYVGGRLRMQVSDASDDAGLLADLERELALLRDSDPAQLETSLLIHPAALADFERYNDFLAVADVLLASMGLSGEIQIASFHPDYRFAGAEADDPANRTNRSPHPMLHLLREASVARAVDALDDPDEIWRRNVRRLASGG